MEVRKTSILYSAWVDDQEANKDALSVILCTEGSEDM
jgi:hypothetical protein